MTGAIVGIILALAFLLLDGNFRPAPAVRTARPAGPRLMFGVESAVRAEPDPHELPLFVHQLAALLQSGRSPQSLWQDALAVYQGGDYSSGRYPDRYLAGSGAPWRTPSVTGRQGRGSIANQVVPVLERAALSAGLGVSPSQSLMEAASQCLGGKQPTMAGLWTDLSACLEVSDRCGAPLGTILGRYAVQLEARLDSVAARETALAGPRASVRLLTWLPIFGLGLGFLMGMNPVAILLGTPLGWAFLCGGLLLMAAGRWWSGRLVTAADKGGLQ